MFPNSRLQKVLTLTVNLLVVFVMESNASKPTPPPPRAYIVHVLRNLYIENSLTVEIECSFGPTHRSQGKKIVATITTNKGLEIFGDSTWQVVLEPDQSYEGSLTMLINPDDTSGFDLHLEGGAWSETYSYYFIYEPGNIECFKGHPSEGRKIRSRLQPFVYQSSLTQIDSNDLWFDLINTNGKSVGYVHTTKRANFGGISPNLVTFERLIISDTGSARKYEIYCDNDKYMTTRLLALKAKRGSYLKFDTVFFSDGTWSPSYSRHNEFETNQDDLFLPNLLHIVSNLKTEVGVQLSYTVPQWDMTAGSGKMQVVYLGTELVRVLGPKDSLVELHKFVNRVNPRRPSYYYYLDANHQLLLVHGGGENLVRTSRIFLTPELFEVNWDSLESALLNR